ncbi:Procollagen-lysine 2-oxoglutarate 5-dioxygenase 3 [Bienertia sinuspersici]
MADSNKLSFADIQNPLFLHPSDNASSISIDRLQGASDYKSWDRSMEIHLSAKRKMGFVLGTTISDTSNEFKSELWQICNNMVLKQLETSFALTNGSRNYKLNKDLYELKQHSASINEY